MSTAARSITRLLALFTIVFGALPARADDESVTSGRHRIELSLGSGLYIAGSDVDHHWPEGGIGFGARAGYAYRLLEGLETGIAMTFVAAPHRMPFTYAPAGVVRVFVPLAPWSVKKLAEIGVSISGGPLIESLSVAGDAVVWTGYRVAASPDLRIGLSEHTALQIAPQISFGSAHASSDQDYERYYLLDVAGEGELMLWASIVSGL